MHPTIKQKKYKEKDSDSPDITQNIVYKICIYNKIYKYSYSKINF